MRPKPTPSDLRQVLNGNCLLPRKLLFDWRPFSQFMKNSPQWLSARFWTGLLLLIFCLRAEGQLWVSHANTGSGERFLFASRVADYNFSSGTWSTAATLPRTGATAMAQDANGIYIAYGTGIYQYSTAFAGETLVGSAANSVHGLFLDGDLLIAVHSAGLYYNVSIYSRATRALLGSNSTYVDSLFGAAHAPGLNKLFGSTSGISPADVVMAAYTEAGIPSGASDSPYHGTYSIGAKNWIAPGELRLINSAGIVYSSSSLTYLTSLGGSLQDVAFNGDLPIVIRGTELVSFANTYLEAGKKTVSGTAVAVSGANSYVFAQTAGNPTVAVIPLADIQAPQPGQPVNPTGLAYTPDAVFMDRDDNVLLFSKAQLSLFRWSTSQRRYLPTLPLAGVPEFAAYSRENHTAYFAYAGGLIRKMDLSAATPVEQSFYTLPVTAGGLATAGTYVVAVANGNNYIRADGTLASSTTSSSYVSPTMTWDPALRRLYHFRDGISPNDLHYEAISATGQITSSSETPYHGDFAVVPPIRVSPDGQLVLIGSGTTFKASDLTYASPLANAVSDAVWRSGKIVTLRDISGVTQLQTWEGTQNTPGSIVRQFSGTPLRLLEAGADLWALTLVQGAPRFALLDASFLPAYISPSVPLAPSALTVSGRTVSSVSLSWQDNSDNEDGFNVEFRPAGGIWGTGPRVAVNTTSATVNGLTAGTAYEFRVTATVETLVSAANAVVSATTLTQPDQPVGEPYNFKVTRLYYNSMTVEWTDNASNETGFTIFRSTTPTGTAVIRNAPANTQSFTDTGLVANTLYYYRIQAVNGAITGDLSAQISARTFTAAAAPASPTISAVTVLSATAVKVKWTDNSSNEDQFIIERSVSPFTTWQSAGAVSFNVTVFTDPAAVPNTTYGYRVRASNTTGSSVSSYLTVTTPKLSGDFLNFTARTGNISYFAFNGPDRIERYDLVARAWLTAIPLLATATALWSDDAGLYVAEGRLLVRINPADGTRTPFVSMQTNITGLATVGDILLAGSGGSYATMTRTNGQQLATFSTFYSAAGFSAAGTMRRIFNRTTGVSPSDIQYLELTAAGGLASSSDSPYHGSYPDATRTFVFPNEARVADDAGIVYSTGSLTYTNSLGGAFTDLAFYGQDIPIVLRSDKLYAYSNTLQETGFFTMSRAGIRVAINGSDALVFGLDAASTRGLTVSTVPLASIQAPQPGQPVNPTGLAYTPDAVFMDRDDNVLLFSKAQLSLFRWSTSQRRYLPTLPLVGVPEFAAYSRENHTAYFAYAGGLIRKMDLSAANPVETPFYSLPRTATGLATAGSIVAASDPSGAWHTHYYILPNGTLGSSAEWNYYSREWTWDPVMRRMYFFRDDTSPNDLHYEVISATGQITSAGETPYHGDFSVVPPIRVSPDGQRVLLGSGVTFVTNTLTLTGTTLPVLADAAWSGTKLYTAISGTNQTTLRTFHPSTFATIGTLPALTGTPVRVLNLPANQLMTVTLDAGKPRFHILNSTDTVTFDSIRDNTAPVLTGFIVQTKMGQAIDVSAAKIVVRATDAEGDSIALTAVTAATLRGGAATLVSGMIHYIPPAAFSGTDEVMLTLTDSRGKSGPSTLQIQVLAEPMQTNPPRLTSMPDGQINILWQGIPGRTYTLQRSPDLSSWTTLGSVVPDAQGTVSFTDNPGIPSAFYRIVAP